ncbi:MAG: hypothetical protein RIC19_19185 [Phaeodactylibacter sp.]|uniref:glycosyl hydrolase family 95 catalytic domain-containing protein n=1 Tax=Phaeodactylibacter sp. TaxID=1940289 RepID=UPI0032EDFA96
MKNFQVSLSLFILLFFLVPLASSASEKTLTWTFPLPRTHTGILIGNGIQGLMVWGQDHQLNVTVSRAGFWDHRGGKPFGATTNFRTVKRLLESGQQDSLKRIFKNEKQEGLPDRPYQLGGGRLELHFPEGFVLQTGTLNLHTGKLQVVIKAPDGTLRTMDIGQAVPGEVTWIRMEAALLADVDVKLIASYDHQQVKTELAAIGVELPTRFSDAGQSIAGFTQSLPEDPSLSVAFQKNEDHLVLTTALGARAESALIASFQDIDLKKLDEQSTDWWTAFSKSLPKVTIPDPKLQEAYDYGLYKMGSVHPPHGVPATLQAAFMETQRIPPWSNDYHFNINIEMIYWPVLASGKFEHLTPLWAMLKQWMPTLEAAGSYFYENDKALLMPHAVDNRGHVVGNFWTGMIDQACAAWMAQLAWLQYQHTLDERLLKEVAFPLMQGTFEGYYAMTEKAADGTLSLPVSVSPEFKGARPDAWGRNASFQLAAYKMTAKNLIQASKILNQPVDERWEAVLGKLPDYALIEGPKGLEHPEHKSKRIALWEGMDLIESHRHHSHLAGIYPFQSFDPFDEAHSSIVRHSINQWIAEGPGRWSGWCVPWAATLHARLGNPDGAIAWLHYWEDNFTNLGRGTLHDANHKGVSLIQPGIGPDLRANASTPIDWNGVGFMEAHNEVMQLDGGFGVLDAIHNLFFQQRDSVLHILPYLPAKWRSFEFEGLHTAGGFVIDGSVVNGKVERIGIESKFGKPLYVQTPFYKGCQVNGVEQGSALLKLPTAVGERLVVRPVE